jgi:branched-chain amino acid transport system permease protein
VDEPVPVLRGHEGQGVGTELGPLGFLAFLVVDGALAGTIYALVALAFVVVYKASRMINFALGEWIMVASRMVAAGVHALGLGLGGALGLGCAGMIAVAVPFSWMVLRRMSGQPLIAFIMVTIGLGTLMRGSAAVAFTGVPRAIALPIRLDPLVVLGIPVLADKLVAGALAAACIGALSWFFHRSRTGLALRAIASDQQVAMAVGIGLHGHVALSWALVGVLSVLAGTLWTFASGGGFGIELVGLKVFPIVIVGGLDSIPGTIVGALLIGILESLAAGYVDPLVGGGFSHVASYVVLLATLFVRPHGLFGRPEIARV